MAAIQHLFLGYMNLYTRAGQDSLGDLSLVDIGKLFGIPCVIRAD